VPKKVEEASALYVKRLRKPGLYAVGGVSGLQVQVTPTGAKTWILRAMVGEKRRDIGLGGYPDIPLNQARERARKARDQIRNGLDPVIERQADRARLIAEQARTITFDGAVKRYLAVKTTEFRNAKHAAQWASTLETYASPILGSMPVASINLHAIVAVLEPIWTEKTETATRVRGRIESVLAWAAVNGYRAGDNPARWKGHLDAVLAKPGKLKNVTHHRALPYEDVPAFMPELRKRQGMASKALEFTILTAARSGETRGAVWDEIDLQARLWTRPASKMKGGKEHRVPLVDSVVTLLEELPRFEGTDLVFPAPRGGPMSDMTLSAVMRRMEVNATPHGFRSTFRDWAEERTHFPTAVSEMALAHAIGNKVEAAYRRGDLLKKRLQLMEAWAKYCDSGR
jgi:integrase